MFFERVQGNDVYNAALNPPFAYQPTATNVYFSNPNTSALTGATTTQTFPSSLFNMAYKYPPPGTAQLQPRSPAADCPIDHCGYPVRRLCRLGPKQ